SALPGLRHLDLLPDRPDGAVGRGRGLYRHPHRLAPRGRLPGRLAQGGKDENDDKEIEGPDRERGKKWHEQPSNGMALAEGQASPAPGRRLGPWRFSSMSPGSRRSSTNA